MATNQRIFGAIPGIEIGATFENYVAMNSIGIHRQTQGGISGSGPSIFMLSAKKIGGRTAQ